MLEAPEAGEVVEFRPDRGALRQLVPQQVMQVLLVLVPAERLLLYLVNLVDPEAVARLPVAVLLRPLPLWYIDFSFRFRVLSVHLGRWD